MEESTLAASNLAIRIIHRNEPDADRLQRVRVSVAKEALARVTPVRPKVASTQ